MSNIYDLAHSLAKGLKESEEFKTLKTSQELMESEETSKKMFNDFRQTQMDLQMKQMQGQEISQEEMEKANQLFETIKLNPAISRLLDSEQRLSVIIEDINKIIFEPIQEIYKEEEQGQ